MGASFRGLARGFASDGVISETSSALCGITLFHHALVPGMEGLRCRVVSGNPRNGLPFSDPLLSSCIRSITSTILLSCIHAPFQCDVPLSAWLSDPLLLLQSV